MCIRDRLEKEPEMNEKQCEQLKALALLQCDKLEICTRENMKRRKVFRPETEKKLQEEPDTQPEALESEASTEKKHEEEQGTQQRE